MEHNRISEYLLSLEREEDPLLRELRSFAAETEVPIVRPETESLLRTLVAAKRPGRILEIGTAIGYSTILLARAAGAGAGGCREFITVESWEKRIPLAEENLRRAGLSRSVQLLHADAGEVLRQLCAGGDHDPAREQGFDLVFLDAAKGQYIHFLPEILRLLPPGGCLVSDNVMQDGDVIESRFAVERRNRTIHARMREYLYELKHHPELETSIIPLGDGVAVSVKKMERKQNNEQTP